MPTTTKYALRSPTSGDDVDVPADIKNLADDTDAALFALASMYRTNYWINGSYLINQRQASSYTCTGGQSKVTVDMLRLVSGTGATNIITPTVITPGAFNDHPKVKLSWDRTVLGSGDSYIETFVDGVHNFNGDQITVGGLSDVSSGTKRYKVQVIQHFGSGGGASGQVVTTGPTITVDTTTSWRTALVTVPSISGKTIGTDGKDHVLIRLVRESAWETGVINFYLGSIMRGNTTARPERRICEDAELTRCQRYFLRLASGTGVRIAVMQASSATTALGVIQLPPMRAAPVIGISNVAHFVTLKADTSAAYACSAVSISAGTGATYYGWMMPLAVTCATGLVAGNATLLFTDNASATLDADAEPW